MKECLFGFGGLTRLGQRRRFDSSRLQSVVVTKSCSRPAGFVEIIQWVGRCVELQRFATCVGSIRLFGLRVFLLLLTLASVHVVLLQQSGLGCFRLQQRILERFLKLSLRIVMIADLVVVNVVGLRTTRKQSIHRSRQPIKCIRTIADNSPKLSWRLFFSVWQALLSLLCPFVRTVGPHSSRQTQTRKQHRWCGWLDRRLSRST